MNHKTTQKRIQMSEPVLDRSKVEIKRGNYGIASYTNLSDQGLIAAVREYKRGTSGRMYPLDKEAISKKVVNSDFWVSRKIDGEFTVFYKKGDDLFTLNPGGTVRVGLPWMQEAAKKLEEMKISDAAFVGELYVKKANGERSRVHDIVSVARNPQSDEELEQIAFAVFDVMSIDETNYSTSDYAEVWESIEKNVSGERFHPVESQMVSTSANIKQIYEKWVEEERAEGVVARSESAGFFKIKPKHTLDVVVLGFTESTGDREGMLHDILVGLKRADGSLQTLTKVGGGFSDDQRREILSDLKDQVVESEYAEVNSDHVAYQMVEPDKVVEISCLDLVSETTRGGSINRMVLDFDGEYKVIRRLPLASVISPQFIRFRDDKSVVPEDIGIEQIAKIVDVASFETNAKELVFPKSEILSRSVYTKIAKESTMVRKFVVFKTNKENLSEEYPAYVFHYTDFSPNRKNPMAREVRVSASLAQITAIRDQFVADNIKKGWNEVGAADSDEPASDDENATSKKVVKKKVVKKKAVKKKAAKKKAAIDSSSAADETSEATAASPKKIVVAKSATEDDSDAAPVKKKKKAAKKAAAKKFVKKTVKKKAAQKSPPATDDE